MNPDTRFFIKSILSRVEDQADRAEHLIALVPEDKLRWAPSDGSMLLCEVLGHLLECLAGFCGTCYAVSPERLAHFADLRTKPVKHCCEKDEALERIREYIGHIREGFEILTDEDL